MKNFAKSKILTIILGTIALAIVVSFSLNILKTIYSVKTLPGLKIAGRQLGNLDKNTATWLLEKEVRTIDKQKIKVSFKDKILYPSSEDLGLAADPSETISGAIKEGQKSIFSFAKELAESLFGKKNILVKTALQEEKFYSYLINNFGENIDFAENATLILKENDYIVIPEKKGMDVNVKVLSEKIKNDFGFLKRPEIELVLERKEPDVFQNEVGAAKEKALAISRAPLILTFEEEEFAVPPREIREWISFVPAPSEKENNNIILGAEINKEKTKEYLEKNIKKEINREPENARFEKDGEKIAVFSLPKNGRELDSEESALKIKEALESLKNGAQLAVKTTPPQIVDIDTEGIALSDLLGEGASNFAGSPKNRRYNIELGTKKIHGFLLKDGETFSINNVLGKVGPGAGYLPELVIKNGKTEPDFGGGLCQVSTTLFRAAINSGLKIVERKAHAYIVRYYGTPGMDATIYQPSPDLKFLNDTGSPVLIQGEIKGNNSYFRIYGKSDGRSTKTVGPFVYDRKPDGSAKARWTQEIYYGETLNRKDVFLSSYNPPDKYPTPIVAAAKTVRIAELGKSGNELFAAGKYQEAKAAFEAILKLDPNHSGAKESINIVNQKLTSTKKK